MKYIKYIAIGMVFGILMTKAEIVSWYRIQEMFRFQSFHMFGIIGSALMIGVIATRLLKKKDIKSVEGEALKLNAKDKSVPRYLIGGIIFGLGWALTGACPGPMYTLIGNGYLVVIVMVASALTGTFFYGLLRDRLPH